MRPWQSTTQIGGERAFEHIRTHYKLHVDRRSQGQQRLGWLARSRGPPSARPEHITFGSRSTCACPRAAAYQRSFAVVYFAASLTGWLPLPSELLRLLYLLCSHTFFHVVSNEFPRSAHLELQDVYLLSFPCSRALVPFSQPSVAGTRACRLRHQWRFGPGRSWVIYLVGPRPFAFASLFSETDPAASFILTRWSDVRNEPACSDRCFARWL
jgi:hypothetical protein